tara:strand:- start:367 stop:1551 length:1185 start_codon:yes stop_codon:yes gene_type:complete
MKIEEIDSEGKSTQQIEKELLAKHDDEIKSQLDTEEVVDKVIEKPIVDNNGIYDLTESKVENKIEDKIEESVVDEKNLNDHNVQEYLRKKLGREDFTFDNIGQVEEREVIKEVERELPSDVASFLKYKEETGRSMSDYFKATVDVSSLDDNEILSRYTSLSNPEFDADDIKFEINSRFGSDDMDDEYEARTKVIAKKKELSKAKEFLSSHNEKYRTPLESSESFISSEDRSLLAKIKSDNSSKAERDESSRKKQEYFSQKTNELFSDKFKGFEFNIDDNTTKSLIITDVDKVKDSQMSAMTFLNTHLDENGMLKDAKKYHKAMYAAQHADEIFKTAYQLGAAEALEQDAREAKNIEMGRKKPESGKRTGTTVREVSSNGSNLRSDGGLRITGRK